MHDWRFHGYSNKSKGDKDFLKLNKTMVREKMANARDSTMYRKQHNIRIHNPEGQKY